MVKKRNNFRLLIDLLASRGSLLILGALTVWLGISAGKEAYSKHQIQQEIGKLKNEILSLEQKNSNVASLIDSFKEPETIELEAKRRLNLKKPSEEVAVILRDKSDELQNIVKASPEYSREKDDDAVENEENTFNNPLKWWQYIVER